MANKYGGGAGSDNIRDGNDYINSSATLNVQARLRPDDSWSAPAGKEVLAQGARWGIYVEFATKSIAVCARSMRIRGRFDLKLRPASCRFATRTQTREAQP